MSSDQMNDTSDTIDATSKDNGEDPTSDLSGGSSPTNMRSSPPVPEDDETVIEDPPKMNKKRSHEEMNAMTDEMFPSSATMIGDVASSAVPPKESDQPDSIKHSQVTHTMGPPALPSSSMPPPSQKTPPSGQGSQKPKANEIKPAGPNPEDREKGPSPEPEHNPEPDDALDAATGEPQEQIDDFDWKDLHSRYHQKMTALDEQENEVMDNFHQLCQYFAIWSDAGGRREANRSFKRLKTQTMYVQHEEDQLEQKRQHYIKVVEAFKSALDLLRM